MKKFIKFVFTSPLKLEPYQVPAHAFIWSCVLSAIILSLIL